MNSVMEIKEKVWSQCAEDHLCPLKLSPVSDLTCQNGMAGEYPCLNVDLKSFIPLDDLKCGGDGNDIWGWTDPNGREYAIFCCYGGTSFVDVSDPYAPKVLGFLPTSTVGSSWRDAKVYKDHVYIVSEAYNHGMQVYDLKKLLAPVPDFTPETVYRESGLGSVHNIVINEETGFAYAVGSKTCRSGLHMIDIRDPKKPKFAGCYADDGYVHDAQCVIYRGPDKKHQGKEICFCYNEDTVTIVDVSDKSSPVMLSRTPYEGSAYTHQGWLYEGSEFLLANDELDEIEKTSTCDGSAGGAGNTRTMKWDVRDLEAPKLVQSFVSPETSIDHNLYIRGNLAYMANYCSGLRILDLSNNGLQQVGFFDVAPDCDSPEFFGSWSSYPYFQSENIIVSSIERGLFVLKYNPGEVLCPEDHPTCSICE